jgi:hypothetical protein
MSDFLSDRKVQPPIRKPSALIKQNRKPDTTDTRIEGTATSPVAEAMAVPLEAPTTAFSNIPQSTPPSVKTEPVPTVQLPERRAEATANSTEVKVAFNMPIDLRDRLRAAFRATKNSEGEIFLAEMYNAAIEREVSRREALYNNSQTFPGGDVPMPRGKPFV